MEYKIWTREESHHFLLADGFTIKDGVVEFWEHPNGNSELTLPLRWYSLVYIRMWEPTPLPS